MKGTDLLPRWIGFFRTQHKRPVRTKLQTRLLNALIPTTLAVLALMGYATYRISSEFITVALERTTRLHATTTAHAVEQFLDQCKRDLLLAARTTFSARNMERYLLDLHQLGGIEYQEFGFISKGADESHVFITQKGTTLQLAPDAIREIRPNPALLYQKVHDLRPGDVWFSDFSEIEYPFPEENNTNARIVSKVLRLVTPCLNEQGEISGFLYLGVPLKKIRNILSLYDSIKSPVFAFPRNPAVARYTFFIDPEGWVLFQSDTEGKADAEFKTLNVRSTYRGTLGKAGFPSAFRPEDDEEQYWRLVSGFRAGGKDLIRGTGQTFAMPSQRRYFLAYAPVGVTAFPDQPPIIIGGVAFEDRSVLIDLAGYKHLDVMLIISVISVLALIIAIATASRGATKGLLDLAHAVKSVNENGRWEEVRLNDNGYEAAILRESINSMIGTIRKQFEEIRAKDMKIELVSLKEPVELKLDPLTHAIDNNFPELIGSGTTMYQMKKDIAKASQADVDVLIEGETGTGKQLVAEAIHRLSQRDGKPFISINCGELDENLLIDSLFGHVKGAFTDGKTDRQGAFLEATGGTLFLDEIQSASHKVQQALLRALSTRKIKPLGSDKDIDVDVRLITATNVDLKKLIEEGQFREDLYYRLKVITIQTPPLREQRQNIPSLVLHFLKEGERMAGKSGLSISRGALKALIAYTWPGNIRELKHLIITAAVMTESNVIQAEELNLNPQAIGPVNPPLQSLEVAVSSHDNETNQEEKGRQEAISASTTGSLLRDLNRRQVTAYDHVLRHGSITSAELIRITEGSISKRTASYDIQDMVTKGLLTKVGRGPTTRYILTRQEENG